VRAVDLQVVRHLLFTKYIDGVTNRECECSILWKIETPQRAFYFADDCVLQRCPPLRFAEARVFGVRRPVLLLPEGIMDRLTPDQLDAVLSPVICHVRRRDNLTAAIHMVGRGTGAGLRRNRAAIGQRRGGLCGGNSQCVQVLRFQ
jgi:hypothetical protein